MHKISLLIIIGLAGTLSACATSQISTPQPTATAGLTPAARTLLAVKDLQDGLPDQAKAELTQLLKETPDSKVGKSLLMQIDEPPESYFPTDSFPVTLKTGESLSTLSETYLHDRFQFYALARYNGIANPSRVQAGQKIRIPKVPTALAAAAKTAADATASPPATPVTNVAPVPLPVQEEPSRSSEQKR